MGGAKLAKKTRIRRGRNCPKKNVNLVKKWKLMHSNVRGVDSKSVSLKAILGTIKPDVVTILLSREVTKKRYLLTN